MEEDYGQLEKKYREPYAAWKKDPSPKNTSVLLQNIQPVIEAGIRAHVGTSISPSLRGHAKRIALDALQRYDPQRARLNTYIMHNLQGLKRQARRQLQIVAVPERVELARRQIFEAQRELEGELGHEPDLTQLADRTGFSVKKLRQLLRYQVPISEGQLAFQQNQDSGSFAPAVQQQDGSDQWLELLYNDLSPTDRNIIDWTLGRNGKPRLSNQQIARRLRLTPGAVSQRKAKIQAMLDRLYANEELF